MKNKYKIIDKIGDLIIEEAKPRNPIDAYFGKRIRIRRRTK